MKCFKEVLPRAAMMILVFTVLCGVIYTGVVTVVAQIIFPHQANGSIIEVDNKKYGSELLAQQYLEDNHMWGRIMNVDVATYKDENNNTLMYSAPSNISPASEEFAEIIAQRVEMIKEAHGDMKETPIPVELVTNSGSGLDPHISPAAANYQVSRLAKANNMSEEKVKEIIKASTTDKFLGVFGEKTVNVLKVNLMLEGIL